MRNVIQKITFIHCKYIKRYSSKYRTQDGFTLVEILVVSLIVGILGIFMIVALSPNEQQKKAQDIVRQQDISQVRSALDLYYHDHNCYPESVPFGSEWKDLTIGTIYMKEVPHDPTLATTGTDYQYVVEQNECPQWYVVYAKYNAASSESCPLAQQESCNAELPEGKWGCVYGGAVNCASLSETSLEPTGTIAPTPTLTPAPTGAPETFTITMNNEYPEFSSGSLSPYNASQGQTVNLTLNASDDSPIVSITAVVATDTTTQSYPLTLSSGSTTSGTWAGSWVLNDTVQSNYTITFEGEDSIGRTSEIELTIK